MEKPGTHDWNAHPSQKAILVLVCFYFILGIPLFCPLEVPVVGLLAAWFGLFYLQYGMYFLGWLYGIWLDCGCHLKTRSFCFVFLILILLVSIGCFFFSIYPDWKRNGSVSWNTVQQTIDFIYVPKLSVIGGYILSRATSYRIKTKQD